MQYKPLHCWDCGIRIIGGEPGQYTRLPNMVEVRFDLLDGSYCESPFCRSCAERPWTAERVLAFEHAVNSVYPTKHRIAIQAVGPLVIRQDPIVGVVDITHSRPQVM